MTATMETLTRGQAVTLARRMAEGGWAVADIRRYLAARGVERSSETIRRWADPAVRDRHREKNLARMRARYAAERNGRLGRDDNTAALKLTRLIALDELGLPAHQVAKLMMFDFGDDLSAGQVRKALKLKAYPKRYAGGRS